MTGAWITRARRCLVSSGQGFGTEAAGTARSPRLRFGDAEQGGAGRGEGEMFLAMGKAEVAEH